MLDRGGGSWRRPFRKQQEKKEADHSVKPDDAIRSQTNRYQTDTCGNALWELGTGWEKPEERRKEVLSQAGKERGA